jgi:hypothetical protein
VETQKQVKAYVATICEVDALLDPATNRCAKRKHEVDPKNWTTAEGVILSGKSPME